MRSAVVTIGNFDGVHRGHQHVIGQAVGRARALGLRSFAVSFFPHPDLVLHPERDVAYLTDPDEKVWLIQQLGVDDVWVCPFTRELSQLEPDQFMRLVAERQPIAELWVGADFALGRDRAGTPFVLAAIGAGQGWALHVVPPFRYAGEVVSSTAIRGFLAEGDLRRASELLGRPYAVCGRLELDAAGRLCARIPADRAVPAAGVYAVRLQVAESVDPVAVEVSPGSNGSGEPHLLRLGALDRAAPPAGARASIAFIERLRPLVGRAAGPTTEDAAVARQLVGRAVQLGATCPPC